MAGLYIPGVKLPKSDSDCRHFLLSFNRDGTARIVAVGLPQMTYKVIPVPNDADYSQLCTDLRSCYEGNCRPCSRENVPIGACGQMLKDAADAIEDLLRRVQTQKKERCQ